MTRRKVVRWYRGAVLAALMSAQVGCGVSLAAPPTDIEDTCTTVAEDASLAYTFLRYGGAEPGRVLRMLGGDPADPTAEPYSLAVLQYAAEQPYGLGREEVFITAAARCMVLNMEAEDADAH